MKHSLVMGMLAATALSACAEPAKVEGMVANTVPVSLAANSALGDAVCVTKVTGGEDTNPLWTSEVDDASFRSALERSLKSNGLEAPSEAACSYDMTANLLGLAQPVAGFNMTVTANVNYSVFDRATQTPYHQSTVVTPYTATVGDAFAGIKRLRLANEGAIRTNIEKYLGELINEANTNPPGTENPSPSS